MQKEERDDAMRMNLTPQAQLALETAIERFNAVPASVIVATTRALRDAERLDAIAWGMGFESAVRSREDAA